MERALISAASFRHKSVINESSCRPFKKKKKTAAECEPEHSLTAQIQRTTAMTRRRHQGSSIGVAFFSCTAVAIEPDDKQFKSYVLVPDSVLS